MKCIYEVFKILFRTFTIYVNKTSTQIIIIIVIILITIITFIITRVNVIHREMQVLYVS